jgi:exopolyphosphatase/guanosine-5'-triphosphate,3'-diphosphate pyrophosphatase
LRQLSAEICPLPLPARLARPGLTAGRADVFPAALVTLLTVAEWGRFDRFTHSLHNLRWGLAAELLDRLPPAPPPPAIL